LLEILPLDNSATATSLVKSFFFIRSLVVPDCNRKPWRNRPPVRFFSSLAVAGGLFALAACTTISQYDQTAYANAVALKVDTLALMESATNSYSSRRKEIAALELQMAKTYEYDRGRPLNQITLQMWDVLLKIDPDHPEDGIWPRFLERWKQSGVLSATYIKDKKENVASAFDKIIGLESGKLRPSAVKKE
jgi:hypothetical protein